MTALPITPVANLTSATDLFRCEPLSCTLTVGSCVERRARFRAGVGAQYVRCGACVLGAEAEARSGVLVQIGTRRRKFGLPQITTVERAGEQRKVGRQYGSERGHRSTRLVGDTMAGAVVLECDGGSGRNPFLRCKFACGHVGTITLQGLEMAAREGRIARCEGCRHTGPRKARAK